MSWITRLFGAGQAQAGGGNPAPEDDFWYEDILRSAAGMRVTVDDAMTVSAFRRGVSVLAGSIASLPLKVYERTADGKRVAERDRHDRRRRRRDRQSALRPGSWDGGAARGGVRDQGRDR